MSTAEGDDRSVVEDFLTLHLLDPDNEGPSDAGGREGESRVDWH
jgi:hypothetical protein